jgi:hypothetical protein
VQTESRVERTPEHGVAEALQVVVGETGLELPDVGEKAGSWDRKRNKTQHTYT